MSAAELVLALDLGSRDEALRLLDRLPELRWVKVGSVLMTAAGPPMVQELAQRGLAVFLDLKWHDIPHTVAGAVRAAAQLGVQMATVHTLGGREMLAAAAREAAGGIRIVGVTVLTSHDAAGYGDVVGRAGVDLRREVLRLAQAAMAAGLDGLVCGAPEVEEVRAALGPGPLVVVPGIRGAGEPVRDQARTATAQEAARAGATHLVVGRPILSAGDPAAAWRSYQEVLV